MNTIIIDTKGKKTPLGDLYGIFFEDLNHAADGGLYGELVRNRAFEFVPEDKEGYHSLTAWEKVERGSAKVQLQVETKAPFSKKNPHYAVIKIQETGKGAGICNLGYNSGLSFVKGESYLLTVYAQILTKTENYFSKTEDSFSMQEAEKESSTVGCYLKVGLESKTGQIIGETNLKLQEEGWVKYEAQIKAESTDYNGKLVLTFSQPGSFAVGYVSLFPVHTYKERRNGMRADIAQLLADMKPHFMRFPGGCLVHDGELDAESHNSMYRWKNTIGSVEERPARRSNWGYSQTLGLGYYEYFQFCEDIGAKPLPVLPGGYDPHHKRIVPLEELQPWIEDALDLIEFANGDTNSVWGAKRAELGHPKPFGLEYIAIGNEEVGEPFFERYPYFHKAIKEKYPEIKIINTSGPFCAGSEYERGWASARENHSDFVDEHYYMSPEWFLANNHRYDNFPAEGPKVFLGEYASWGNTWYNALAEASYMTALERNAHAVGLACYAPMLCNVDYINWQPDMIWFDNYRVYATPNYYVQKLFMNHQGIAELSVIGEGFENAEVKKRSMKGKFAVKGDQTKVCFTNLKVTNPYTGESKLLNKEVIVSGKDFYIIGETEWEDYILEGDAVELEGYKGWQIAFAMEEKNGVDNTCLWTVGGWQNQDMAITERIQGRSSDLTQCLFSVEKNHTYHLRLTVKEGKIWAQVDGKEYLSAERKPVVIEPLYYCASEDKNGDIILKVVNIKEESVYADIILQGITSSLKDKGYQVKGYQIVCSDLEACNSFEEPEKIKDTKFKLQVEGKELSYTFPGYSVTILRLEKIK